MALMLFPDLSPINLEENRLPFHYVRFTAYLISSLALAAGLLTQHFPATEIYAILFSILYPLLSHCVAHRPGIYYPNLTHIALIVGDMMVFGFLIVYIQFDPVVSLLLLLAASPIALVAGIRGWVSGLGCMVVGVVIGYLVLHPVQPEFPTYQSVFIFPLLVPFILLLILLTHFSHKQAKSLMHVQTELIQHKLQASALSRKLAKYLPPQVWASIFAGKTDARLQTHRKRLTVFFSDIKGFVDISENLQPEALTDLLNSYFTEMSAIALKHGGTIDKFIGDAIMIFFGDPTSQGARKDALACVSMAIEMRKKVAALHRQWRKYGITKPVQIRMGINTGYCTVGNFGAESRMDYTIIGKEVNLASRLESLAEPDQILISEHVCNLVTDTIMCRSRGNITVKGFSHPVPIFNVINFRKDLGATRSFLEYELDGFAMYMDFDELKTSDRDRVVEVLESATKRVKTKVIG